MREWQALRKEHRVLIDTFRLQQLQIDDTIARGSRIEQNDRVHATVGPVSRIISLCPLITVALANIIAKHEGLCLVRRAERFQVQIIMNGRIARTACDTQRHIIVTSRYREIECRVRFIGPSVRQAFYVPFITLDMIVLASERITQHVVNLLNP